jgi:hypothetical protein
VSETPGTLIGLSNAMTAARSRVPSGTALDPAVRDRLRTRARREIEAEESYIEDAIIAGRRVRLFSNSHHLADFWRENWLSEREWSGLTGVPVPPEPALTVWAMIRAGAERPGSHVGPGEAFLFNTSYYADLRATAMEALGRTVESEGLKILHAGAVALDGRLLVTLYPKELIHPTPPWSLMELPASRFMADGWIAVDAQGRVSAIERRPYVRTSLLASYPGHAGAMIASKFENVPDLSPEIVDRGLVAAQALLEAAQARDTRRALRSLPADRARDLILRLVASRDSRAMVDPAALFGKARVARGPSRPAAVFELKAAAGTPVEPTSNPAFRCPAHVVHVNSVGGDLARLLARTAGL